MVKRRWVIYSYTFSVGSDGVRCPNWTYLFFCEQAELTATISNNGNKNTEKQTNRQWTH